MHKVPTAPATAPARIEPNIFRIPEPYLEAKTVRCEVTGRIEVPNVAIGHRQAQ
jgi:hypothetical protein